MTRRRRLTIAALVLLALGGGLWWATRPRIDPRLVGRWTYLSSNERRISTQRTFSANGYATLAQHLDVPDMATLKSYRWRVVDNQIELRPNHGSDLRGLWKNFVQAFDELRGIRPQIVRLRIVDVTNESLKLEQYVGKSGADYYQGAASYIRAPETDHASE